MLIDDFYVYDFPVGYKCDLSGAFVLRTCLRTLVLSTDSMGHKTYKAFVGQDGYAFLLRVACGLESRIPGETEIFGQFKQAWTDFVLKYPQTASVYQSLMQKLFADTKMIRQKYLSGMGGSTYGTALRKILGSKINESVLIFGAGQLCEMILPSFKESVGVYVCNRDINKAHDLLRLSKCPHAHVLEEDQAVKILPEIENIIFCVPEHAYEHLQDNLEQRRGGTVIHLGSKDVDWDVFGFLNLADVFRMQGHQSEIRKRKMAHAKTVCTETAQQRSLMDAINLCQGWEDLPGYG
jgi:glutamyl-tRNA reductase